jgi:hypothetical protein
LKSKWNTRTLRTLESSTRWTGAPDWRIESFIRPERRGVLTRLAALALSALASIEVARANCFPPRQFSQLGPTTYHYVLFPPGTPATSQSIVGRFWQPGEHAGAGEGACEESSWLIRCAGDCPATTTTPAFYINGFTGTSSCSSGCPTGEMILLLQEQSSAGGLFAVARVTEAGGNPAFDFSRLERDLTLAAIPRPRIMSSERIGPILRLGFQIDDPAPGFFGLPGVPASGTITAINVYTKIAPTAPPQRTTWTLRQRLPYTGGTTAGTIDVNAADTCLGGGYDFYLATALELDGGEVVTDYVSWSTRVTSCIPETLNGAGEIPEDSLLVSRSALGDLALSWTATCFPAVGAYYGVYEGTMGEWMSYFFCSCRVSGTATSFPEPAGSAYYLVVPFAENFFYPDLGPGFEGSYGMDSADTERLPSIQACAPRWFQTCP